MIVSVRGGVMLVVSVMAYVVMAYIVMLAVSSYGLCSHGVYSYVSRSSSNGSLSRLDRATGTNP